MILGGQRGAVVLPPVSRALPSRFWVDRWIEETSRHGAPTVRGCDVRGDQPVDADETGELCHLACLGAQVAHSALAASARIRPTLRQVPSEGPAKGRDSCRPSRTGSPSTHSGELSCASTAFSRGGRRGREDGSGACAPPRCACVAVVVPVCAALPSGLLDAANARSTPVRTLLRPAPATRAPSARSTSRGTARNSSHQSWLQGAGCGLTWACSGCRASPRCISGRAPRAVLGRGMSSGPSRMLTTREN